MTGLAARRATLARSAREWARSLAIAFAVWLFLRTFVVEAFHIPSGSMENTLLVGDWLFVTRAYGAEIPFTDTRILAWREPGRGDLVVFNSVEADFPVVKRVMGVPGDTLAMAQGELYRNGERLHEPYVIRTDPLRSETPGERARMRAWQLPHLVAPAAGEYAPDVHDWGPLVIPPDSLFMMGDNRDNSVDSRYWGLVPRGNVRGRPALIYYSFDRGHWLPLPFITAIRWRRLFSVPR